jgi:putative addiction module killer protein
MFEVRQTTVFARWIQRLRDPEAVARIAQRVRRIERGLMGDVKYFQGIGEIRIDYGPGYRVYFMRDGQTVVLLLCGGDKSSQKCDIMAAVSMAEEIGRGD